MPFIFSVGELIFDENLQTFKDRPTVRYEVVWSHQPELLLLIFFLIIVFTAEFQGGKKTTKITHIMQRNLHQK